MTSSTEFIQTMTDSGVTLPIAVRFFGFCYERIGRVVTAPGARTAYLSTELEAFYLAVPARGVQKAEIRAFALK
jgi:hypothetical protein